MLGKLKIGKNMDYKELIAPTLFLITGVRSGKRFFRGLKDIKSKNVNLTEEEIDTKVDELASEVLLLLIGIIFGLGELIKIMIHL